MPVHTVVRGNVAAPKTLIFIHGWPDTEKVWEKQVQYFEKDYRIVLLVLPGYRATDKTPFFGHDLLEVADMLAEAIRTAMTGRTEKPVLIVHDWGAVLGHIIVVDYPTLVERVAFLDIGCHVGSLSAKAIIMVLAYQWTLLFAFLLPRFLANPLTRLAAVVLKVPKETREQMHAGMNYFYLQMWKRRLTGTLPKALKGWCPPEMPVLFLYGQKKPFAFHSKRWLDYLEKTPGCKSRGFPAGHWFFNNPSLVEQVNSEIAQFVKAKL